MTKDFNLIDEEWIPVVGEGRVSLKRIFSDENLFRLSGTPLEKIALLKFLQAISQAAGTPLTTEDWRTLGEDLPSFGKRCIDYLERHCEEFNLYGEKPFLQMALPQIKKAKTYGLSERYPFVASGNNVVVRQSQLPYRIDDGEKALLLLTLMSCDLGGKRHDNKVVLARNYEKKSAHAGPAIGLEGTLHSFCLGNSILETVWLNTFTQEEINKVPQWPKGLGIAPWEKMPETENDAIANNLKKSLMGRLVPMCRFCFLEEDEIHVTEGLFHGKVMDGVFDPSHLLRYNKEKDTKFLTKANPKQRPWRELTAILSFLDANKSRSTVCQQVQFACRKLANASRERVCVWSGGVQVSSNSGEQKVSGSNDFIESETIVELTETWYQDFLLEMNLLEKQAKYLQNSIENYFAMLESFVSESTQGDTSPNGEGTAVFKRKAGQLSNQKAEAAMLNFWQHCERYQQEIVDNCEESEEKRKTRKKIVSIMKSVFNSACPRDTSQQLRAWAATQPRFGKYLES